MSVYSLLESLTCDFDREYEYVILVPVDPDESFDLNKATGYYYPRDRFNPDSFPDDFYGDYRWYAVYGDCIEYDPFEEFLATIEPKHVRYYKEVTDFVC